MRSHHIPGHRIQQRLDRRGHATGKVLHLPFRSLDDFA
jgi:hypothetical protein